jgi:hypothetical protein
LQKKTSREKEKNEHFDFKSFCACVQKHHLKTMQKIAEALLCILDNPVKRRFIPQ